MSLSIPYTTKVNERISGVSITSESHIIGIVGTATYSPGLIRLIEVPQAPSPLSTVSIPGYNEITSGTPTGMQFLVDYDTGVITFATAQDGNTVSVSYIGLGSEIAAEDINELQNPLGTIATQSITYNWPSAPTVSWSLTPNIVLPASISNGSTNDFTFPRDVIVTRNLITLELTSSVANSASTGVIRLADTDTIAWRNNANSANLALGINGSDQLTFNGSPIGVSSLTSAHIFVGNGSNIATDVAVSGDLTLVNTGAFTIANAVVTGTKIASATITNTNVASGIFSSITGIGTQSQALNMNSHLINNVTDPVSAQDAATKNYVDTHGGSTSPAGSSGDIQFNNSGLFGGSNNLFWDNTNIIIGVGTNSPDLTSILDLVSTTQGFLVPRMTTTQRDAISHFATGTVNVVNFAALSGAVLTVNGFALTEGVQWTAATSNNATATSLASAITTATASTLSTASAAGAVVTITANATGSSGNSITLTTSDPTNLPVSGPTLTGGSDPAEALQVYDLTLHQLYMWNSSSWVIVA